MHKQHKRKPFPYSFWIVSCLFGAALLLIIAAALLAEQRVDDPLTDWDTLNEEIEQVIFEWEASLGVQYELVDGKVPINSAPQGQLETLPGIGPSKAKAIIEYREQNGYFTEVDELMKVSGIGAKTMEQLQDKITIQTH